MGKKISTLLTTAPAAVLDGTEGLEILQSSGTKGATASQFRDYVDTNLPARTSTTQAVADLAALKALTTRPPVVIVKTGQAAGEWQWAAGSSTTADDALVVQCTSGTAGRYKRIYDGPVLPQWFGALGDGTDQAVALQAWLNKYRDGYSIYAPPGDYRTSVGLTLMPYTTAAPPTATTQNPRPSIVFDRKAVFKATASMTTLLTLGSTDSDYSGAFYDGLVTGGTFDANFLATNCIHAKFFFQLRLDAVDCRNALGTYIKMGDSTSPSVSFEAMVTNSRTARDIIAIPITGITKANPAVVSAVNSLVNGDVVCIRSVGGMTEVNDLYFTVAGATGTSFQLSGIDSSAYTTYTSGGSAYLTVNGKGIGGVYFENTVDNQLINNILTGAEVGVAGLTSSGTLGVFDNKYTNVHVWNYLENGRLLYGFDVGGDNSLVGCQVDGPFQYGYRFTGPRNALVASNVNYTPLTYGGRDNTDYAITIGASGGVACFGCVFKAQSASARLADVVTGTLTNFISNNQSVLNVVATTFSSQVRRDANAALIERLANQHTGASASVQHNLVSDAGTFFRYATSSAGGAGAFDDWSGTGDRFYQAGSAGARHRFQYNYSDRFVIGANSGAANLSAVPMGYGFTAGVGGTVAQGSGSGKATGVELNKVTGLITMDGATLNADTTVSFTLTNSTIASTDTIILNHVSGGTAGSYLLNAQAGSGSASINVRNITAGNLTESPVIRFTVIKSVSA